MAITITDHDLIFKAIETGIHAEISKVIEEEIEQAKVSIETKIRKSVDAIALSVLSFYSMERMGAQLIITVNKNPLQTKPAPEGK